MKCARQLFYHARDQEVWAITAFALWSSTGKTPERLRDERNPNWRKAYEAMQRRKTTQVMYY